MNVAGEKISDHLSVTFSKGFFLKKKLRPCLNAAGLQYRCPLHPCSCFYLNKYFHSFFSSVFTSTTKHIHPMSYSFGKPKERIIRKRRFRIMKFQSYETYSLQQSTFKDQIIITLLINKAQKDCDCP